MTSTDSEQTISAPAKSRPRAGLGSTLLPLLALGVLFLVLFARAALDYPQILSSAQADPRSPTEASSAL